jgi:hypothetical protein
VAFLGVVWVGGGAGGGLFPGSINGAQVVKYTKAECTSTPATPKGVRKAMHESSGLPPGFLQVGVL